MIRVVKSRLFCQQLTAEQQEALVADFRHYKESGELPDTFGRDVGYDHPHTYPLVKAEQVAHIHLTDGEHPWPGRMLQFHRTSDIHLVYCPAASHRDVYLLIAVLAPDAHQQATDNNQMAKIGVIAEQFRQRF